MKKLYKELLNLINSGESCALVTELDKNNVIIKNKYLTTRSELKDNVLLGHFNEQISLALDTRAIGYYDLEDRILIIEPFIPKPRLIIFGGGHISKPLSELAARVGFSVTVLDDRSSFANSKRFPDAKEIICDRFENAHQNIDFRESDYVVIVTRGHRYDGIVLRQVLSRQLAYIGMIGSKRRVKGMMEELANEGYAKDKLSNIHSPIGLDIAAITPDEISISIVAQLIENKNKAYENKNGKKYYNAEFDADVIEKIIEVSHIPSAIITILSTKGSVPRKSGAKMLAYYDGRTIGSIGGGCSEAAVLTKARELMVTQGYFIAHLDMTGDVAESEGMVCGGVMDILIEVIL